MDSKHKLPKNIIYISRDDYSEYKEYICNLPSDVWEEDILVGLSIDYLHNPNMVYCDIIGEISDKVKENVKWMAELNFIKE